jgi:hypothetical protein
MVLRTLTFVGFLVCSIIILVFLLKLVDFSLQLDFVLFLGRNLGVVLKYLVLDVSNVESGHLSVLMNRANREAILTNRRALASLVHILRLVESKRRLQLGLLPVKILLLLQPCWLLCSVQTSYHVSSL